MLTPEATTAPMPPDSDTLGEESSFLSNKQFSRSNDNTLSPIIDENILC